MRKATDPLHCAFLDRQHGIGKKNRYLQHVQNRAKDSCKLSSLTPSLSLQLLTLGTVVEQREKQEGINPFPKKHCLSFYAYLLRAILITPQKKGKIKDTAAEHYH